MALLSRKVIVRDGFFGRINPNFDTPSLAFCHFTEWDITWLKFGFVDMIDSWPCIECSEEWIGIDWSCLCLAWWIVLSKLTHDDHDIELKLHRWGCKALKAAVRLVRDIDFISMKRPTETNAKMAKMLDRTGSTTMIAVWQWTYAVSLAGNIRTDEREWDTKYERSCTDDEEDLRVEIWEMVQKYCLGIDEQFCW